MRVPPNARQGLYAVCCMVCNRFACLHVLQRRVLYLYVASCVFYLLSYVAQDFAASVHCGLRSFDRRSHSRQCCQSRRRRSMRSCR